MPSISIDADDCLDRSDGLMCPYCGDLDTDCWDYAKTGIDAESWVKCAKCGERFNFFINVSARFYSTKRTLAEGCELCDKCGSEIRHDEVIKSRDDTQRLCQACGLV